MSDYDPAPYMHWAKERPQVSLDLAGSNILQCAGDEVPGLLDGLEPNGANPDGHRPLVEAIAAHHGVDPSWVALGQGCSGANALVCAALLGADDEAAVETPWYDPLPAAVRTTGAHLLTFERRFEDGFAVDPESVAWAITPMTRLIIVTSPHNPSGVVIPESTLLTLGETAAKAGAWVLVDEVYLDSVYADKPRPAARVHPRLISTGSLTKCYGLSGLRCGWVVAEPRIAERVRRVRDALDANGPYPMEVAGARAFGRIHELAWRTRRILEPNYAMVRKFMADHRRLEWVAPGGGTMVFPRISGVADAGPFVDTLLRDHDTAVVPGRFFRMPGHFRMAFGNETTIVERGLEAVGKVLASL